MRALVFRASALRLVWVALVALAALLQARTASAYPWMIRHDYTGCGMCHLDPSGGGVLTAYGRAQSDLLLRTHFSHDAEAEEPDRSAGFAWGLVEPPQWLLPSASVRDLLLATRMGAAAFVPSVILMQADARLGVAAGGFRAYGSIGAVSNGGAPAAAIAGNLVSRQHWLGYAFGEDGQLLLRAGRIDVPFGLRIIDHSLFVRSATRTTLDVNQQHGLAVSYSGDLLRGEVMAIAGNFQLATDAMRERGYSGFAELAPLPNAAFGVSSLWTHANQDRYLNVETARQAHGIFARFAPWRSLVLMAEGDYLRQAPRGTAAINGYATVLRADLEPLQGLHFLVTGENMLQLANSSEMSWGGWLGVDWFALPHADVRADFMRRHQWLGATSAAVTALMLQLHVFL